MLNSPRQILHYLAHPQHSMALTLPEWQQLIWLLREAKLLASFAAILERENLLATLPDYVKRHLKSALIYADKQSQQIKFECQELQSLFLKEGINTVYLKGAAYTLASTSNSRGRICNDLDILVPKAQLKEAEDLLNQHRWIAEQLNTYDERYYRKWSHEIPPMVHLIRGTVLDLHHNLYLPISGRAADMSIFFNLVVKTRAGFSVLNPEAMVLHSVIHLFMNEETQNAIRDLWDIHLLISENSSDEFWQKLHKLAELTGFQLELKYCLTALNYYLYSALDPVSKNQCDAHSCDNLWVRLILLPSLVPEHPIVCTARNRWAKRFMYLRGHWLKMPMHILISHLLVKGFLGLKDALTGKHDFSPKRLD